MFRDEVFRAIQLMSGQKNVISIPRFFIHLTGDTNTALLLTQLLYWSDLATRKDGYIYKSYSDWSEEIGLTEYQVRKCSNKLQSMGLLETKLKKANGAPTVHYRLNKDNFLESILKLLQNPSQTNSGIQSEETSETLTKITTKITTNNSSSGGKTLIDVYHDMFIEKYGIKPNINGSKDGAIFKRLEKTHGREVVERCLKAYFLDSDPFLVNNGHSAGIFSNRFNGLLVKSLPSDEPIQVQQEEIIYDEDGVPLNYTPYLDPNVARWRK